jgi:thioredoxin 1
MECDWSSDVCSSDLLNGEIPVLVDFWASWCNPCRAIVPHLEKLQEDLQDKVKLVKINIEENQAITIRYKIQSLPTLILFKNGEVADQMVGNPGFSKLRDFVEKHF